jgi:hypothetical protein
MYFPYSRQAMHLVMCSVQLDFAAQQHVRAPYGRRAQNRMVH